MINPVPRGSKVGIVSPSSALDSPEDIRDGLRWLESCGYRVVLGTHVYDRLNHMAGTPEQQAEDLMRFFADPEIRAVFAAAGGFGAQYLLPLLDYDLIRKNPKPLIGFSDTTALQAGILARTGNVCYAGILLKYDFGRGATVHPYTAESFLRAMDGRFEDIRGGTVVNPGTAEGRLVGTNLCVLQSLAGTPYYPDLTDTILLLEDVDEKSYRIERMLLQLRQQPSFASSPTSASTIPTTKTSTGLSTNLRPRSKFPLSATFPSATSAPAKRFRSAPALRLTPAAAF